MSGEKSGYNPENVEINKPDTKEPETALNFDLQPSLSAEEVVRRNNAAITNFLKRKKLKSSLENSEAVQVEASPDSGEVGSGKIKLKVGKRGFALKPSTRGVRSKGHDQNYARVKQANVESGAKEDFDKAEQRVKEHLRLFNIESNIDLHPAGNSRYILQLFIRQNGELVLDGKFEGDINNIMKKLALHMVNKKYPNKPLSRP